MIHLEEYLDTLEALPMELQRQFTLMRELDALSQDIQTQMKQATKTFIHSPPTKSDPRHAEYLENFAQLFATVLKHGEEKVALATQTYDLVDKHIRKLDDDLAKFEERQLALPPRIPHAWGPVQQQQQQHQHQQQHQQQQQQQTMQQMQQMQQQQGEEDVGGGARKRRGGQRDSSPLAVAGTNGSNGGGAPKAATPSGRRANGRGNGSQSGSTSTTGAAAAAAAAAAGVLPPIPASKSADGSRARGGSKVPVQDFSEMPIDPNEPRYCYCRQVSYGEMVACDDDNCEIEWFHLGCVDLKAPPKGQWFCRECSHKHKKRRDHH